MQRNMKPCYILLRVEAGPDISFKREPVGGALVSTRQGLYSRSAERVRMCVAACAWSAIAGFPS